MKYGLSQAVLDTIIKCISAIENIEQVILYGSRAKGNYKNGSDIDIVLKGSTLTLYDVYRLEDQLEELLLPYRFDVSIYHQIENPDLIEHVCRVGVLLYQKEKMAIL